MRREKSASNVRRARCLLNRTFRDLKDNAKPIPCEDAWEIRPEEIKARKNGEEDRTGEIYARAYLFAFLRFGTRMHPLGPARAPFLHLRIRLGMQLLFSGPRPHVGATSWKDVHIIGVAHAGKPRHRRPSEAMFVEKVRRRNGRNLQTAFCNSRVR